MGANKDLFLLMREKEVVTTNFLPTKKELKKSASDLVYNLLEAGETDVVTLYTQAVRLKEATATLESELKKELPQEGFEGFGVKGVFSGGGYTLDYSKDDVHAKLTEKLKQREELLKTADKSDEIIYDSDGADIPKLPRKFRASSIRVSF